MKREEKVVNTLVVVNPDQGNPEIVRAEKNKMILNCCGVPSSENYNPTGFISMYFYEGSIQTCACFLGRKEFSNLNNLGRRCNSSTIVRVDVFDDGMNLYFASEETECGKKLLDKFTVSSITDILKLKMSGNDTNYRFRESVRKFVDQCGIIQMKDVSERHVVLKEFIRDLV